MQVEKFLPRTRRGLTLVELMTTLAVAGVSLAVAIPSWSALTDRSQVTTTTNRLLGHLRYARSEAVTRRRMVSLCPSDDGATCSGDPFGWQRGYLIFQDTDGNRSRSDDETLLRVQRALPPGMRLHSTAGRPAIRFRPDGAAWSTNTSFSVCVGDTGSVNRAVVLYGSGRARVGSTLPGERPVTCT